MINLIDPPTASSAIARRCTQLFFAGLASLVAQGAMAIPYTTSTSSSSWGGTWNSTIKCTLAGVGENVVDRTSVTQSATVDCTVTNNGNQIIGSATCQLDISYSRPDGLTVTGMTQCLPSDDFTTSTLTDVAFCGKASRGLEVSGTLDCNPDGLAALPAICDGNPSCTANLDGIADVPNGKCGTVFPDDTGLGGSGLAVGQVLNVSVTTTGPSCDGDVIVEHSSIATRFCNSGSFNVSDPSRCLFGTGNDREVASITGETDVFLPVEVEVSPETINVKCDGNKDNGKVGMTIPGSDTVDVERINPATLTFAGLSVIKVGGSCDASTDVNEDGFLDLTCSVPSCPDLGPILEAERSDDDGTVTIKVTGSLYSRTEIRGEDTVGTSPSP